MFDHAQPLAFRLSPRQARVYGYLLDAKTDEARPPEIAEHLGLDRRTVHDALDQLLKAGLIINSGEGRATTYTVNATHILHEPLTEIRQQTRVRLQERLDALMQHGWTAVLFDDHIELTGPADRASKQARAEQRVRDEWKVWTGATIEIRATIATAG